MKKLLIAALLILALVFTVVACTDGTPEDTTPGDTTVETPTTAEPSGEATEEPSVEATEEPSAEVTEDVTGEEPTVEDTGDVTTEEISEVPTDDPVTTEEPAPVTTEEPETLPYKEPGEAGQVAASFDTFYVNGAMYFEADGGAGDKLTAIENTIVFKTGAAHDSMMLRGWIGFGQAIDSFGYYVDGYNFVYGDFARATEDPVKAAGGENASRFEITVPLADLAAGDHKVGFIAKLADGTVVRMREEITVTIERLGWNGSGIITHQSFDQFYTGNGNAENGPENFFTPGASADWDFVATLPDFSVETLTYWGWVAVMGEIGQFGYQINGGEILYNDEWTWATEQPVIDAAKSSGADTGSRMKIFVNIAGLEGENLLTLYYKTAEGDVVVLNDITVVLPEKPKDITNTFVSDVNSNAAGTTHDASDLADYFTMELPLGGCSVGAYGDGLAYLQSSISNFYADVNGLYFVKANVVESNANGWMFVRGYKVVNSDEVIEKFDPNAGIYKINNYYETDGSMMGGAGIYARVDGTNLYLMIKYYNADAITRVGNKLITIPAEGTELTMADDGSVVSIMVNGKTYVTIALSGSVVYEDINEVLPKNGFAASAVITYVDGTTETIENTLIADTCECQVGVVARAGNFRFTSIEVGALSAIEIPAIGEEPSIPQNTNLFQSDVASNAPGTRFDASDLNSNGMTCFLPLPDSCVVQDKDGDGVSDAYYLSGINEVFGDVNGAYSFGADFIPTAGSGSSMMIVRGYRSVVSADYPGPYHINNYYESDDATAGAFFAGAGIGTTMAGGNLYVCVKAYDEASPKHVKNVIVSTPVTGTNITVADNGETVYILVDGAVCATVEFSGETTYEKITSAGVFAQTVTVTMADGTTETVENTLVASTYTQVALATRSGDYLFTSVKVGTFDEVEFPAEEEPETPEDPIDGNYNVPIETWTVSGHNPAVNDSSNGMVAAGGVSHAALLHQGSIYVGDIDLSKYSKVVVYCGCDASDVTQNVYNANANNRIIVSKVDTNSTMSPAEENIVAASTYTLHGWAPEAVEIDLTGIDYNGPVYITYDTLPGTFMLVSAVEFIA